MWELDCEEGWAPKNWCFWTVVLQTLESPLDSKETNQLIIKEINSEYSLQGLILNLKLQYFGYLMQRLTHWKRKILMLGKIEGRRKRGWQRMSWLEAISDSMDMSLSKPGEIVKDREAQHAAVHGVAKSWTQQSNWTKTTSTTTMTWPVSPTMCWSPNHQYPRMSNKVCAEGIMVRWGH